MEFPFIKTLFGGLLSASRKIMRSDVCTQPFSRFAEILTGRLWRRTKTHEVFTTAGPSEPVLRPSNRALYHPYSVSVFGRGRPACDIALRSPSEQ